MFQELISSSPFWTIVGVVIGVLLGEGSRYIRYRIRIFKLKRIVSEELRSLKMQIPLKVDIIKQIIENLKSQKILQGLSVESINIGYLDHISELYEHLPKLQRNCLHVIYETVRIADDFLNHFYDRIIVCIKEKIIDEPFAAYIGHFEDVLQSFHVVSELIDSYLNDRMRQFIPIFTDRSTRGMMH